MHQSKVMLIGEDWGSLLDLKMIEQRPDLFVAYVGTDPLVSWIAKQDVEYEYTKSRAAASHDQKTLDALNQAGPPPYRSLESYRRVPRLLPPEATQQSLAWGESWHTRQACQSRSCLGGTRGCERAKRT